MRPAVVSSEYLPNAITGLLCAQTPDEAKTFYWQLENHVVVQGQTFEVAEHLVPVLVAALLEEDLPTFVRFSLFNLLFQIVAYEPSHVEIELGNGRLTNRCQTLAREGLWTFYQIYLNGSDAESESAYDILEKIETDAERLEAFRSARTSRPE